jgi:acyl-CoA synthetase (AMP-forming)/AMP-acid ligase II
MDALRATGERLSLSHEQRSGDVVLHLASPLKLATALLALDGTANRILLLSPATPLHVTRSLVASFESSTVLTDEPDRLPPGVQAVPWTDNGLLQEPADLFQSGGRDTLWTFATSGTSGTPKLVAHRLASLTRTIKVAGFGPNGWRWGMLFDMARFAGIQVFLQGVLGGGGVVLPNPTAPLGEQVGTLVRQNCSAVSATPTMWRKLLMTTESNLLQLRQVTLGGEIADNSVLSALAARFRNARIVHIYASTEAGAAFSVVDGQAGFPASYLDDPPRGIRLRLFDRRLAVHNEAVLPEYVGEGSRFAEEDGFIDTGDVVERMGDRIYFRGRENGAINVGGNKVFPEEVEQLLLAHPLVASARVYAKASPITGQLVAAEIVQVGGPIDDSQPLVADLRAWCRETLPPWQVPVFIKVVEHLAINPGGKIVRGSS